MICVFSNMCERFLAIQFQSFPQSGEIACAQPENDASVGVFVKCCKCECNDCGVPCVGADNAASLIAFVAEAMAAIVTSGSRPMP